MNSHRLSPAFELKSVDLNEVGTFTGYASTFGGTPDSYGDVIARGAFAETLATHTAKSTVPAMLWAHDQSEPIGRWQAMYEDQHGLYVEGKLTLATNRGKEAHELMRDGAVGLSIGYMVKDWGAGNRHGTRLLKSIDLFEISIVAIPANHRAQITSVKSYQTIREFEVAARDALNLTSRQAKALASGGYAALMRRDDRSTDLNPLVNGIEAETRKLKSLLKGMT
ncbi:HK97 family phage prohead protease [Azospirillum sp. 412522]|nr:HK97 family phage prohead protease [Azospirillum sp. 412522]MBY6262237.1 HK97 family phage prohead protease [Azospirillum sp. 412522]